MCSKRVEDIVEVEDVPFHRVDRRRDLFAAHLIAPAVDGVEQAFCEVRPCAEELHLLADDHRRHAAGDRAVVAPGAAHDLVALELDRARVDGHLRGEPAEAVGQPRRVPDREVRFGRGAEIVERLQQTEAGLGDERAAVVAHSGDRLGDPGRVAGEQFVVLGCPEEADDAQFDHEVVDDLLRLLLVERPGGEIAFEVDVEKRGGAAERHRRAVLFLHSGEVAEVQPLHRFFRRAGRAREIKPVARRHRDQFLECPDLLGQLLAVADDLVAGPAGVERGLLLLFALDQAVDAIERNAPVVADDPAATVCVRQAGQHVRAAALADGRRIRVEHAFVVRLAIFREGLDDVGIGFVAVGLEGAGDHPEAAIRHDGAFERSVGLQANDDLAVPVDVAGCVRRNRTGNLGDVEDALLALLDEQRLEGLPDLLRACGRGREKTVVAVVRLVVLLDEIADVDLLLPESGPESAPG